MSKMHRINNAISFKVMVWHRGSDEIDEDLSEEAAEDVYDWLKTQVGRDITDALFSNIWKEAIPLAQFLADAHLGRVLKEVPRKLAIATTFYVDTDLCKR